MGKVILLGASSILGIGLPAGTTFYYRGYETIWDLVKEKALHEEENKNDKWKILESGLALITEELTNTELKQIKEKTISNHESSGNELKNWCTSAYFTTYKSIFQKENRSLLKDVNAACILTIEKKLGKDKILKTDGEEDQSIFKINLKTLKDYREETDGKLNDGLNKLKKTIESIDDPSTGSHWEDLKKQCEEIYKEVFIDNQLNSWKLANKFCKKGQTENNPSQ